MSSFKDKVGNNGRFGETLKIQEYGSTELTGSSSGEREMLLLKGALVPLAVWLTWLEHPPVNQKVTGLMVGQDTCLRWRFGHWLEHVQEATDLFLSLLSILSKNQ